MTVSFNLCKTKIPSVFDIYTNKTNLCSHFSLCVYVLIKLEKQRIIIIDCDTDPNYSIVSARKKYLQQSTQRWWSLVSTFLES